MKLIEIEITNIRGIPHLLIKPDGKHFAVWGPNGSGKSAVVDAIDFLLTGRISRLTGSGTGGITLSKHGPHIDHKPEEAKVRDLIQLPNIPKPIEISRCIAYPYKMETNHSNPSDLDQIKNIAQRGQHVLTRREILKYITSDASTRAQEIQELLNITEIEDIRKSLVKAQNDLDRDKKSANTAIINAEKAVSTTVAIQFYKEEKVKEIINANRSILGGNPISTVISQDLKKEITPPITAGSDVQTNISPLLQSINTLEKLISNEKKDLIASHDKEIRSLILKSRSDQRLLKALPHQRLIRTGMELLTATGHCPLCNTPWPPGKLKEHLEQELLKVEEAQQIDERIKVLCSNITSYTDSIVKALTNIKTSIEKLKLAVNFQRHEGWRVDLQILLSKLKTLEDDYTKSDFKLDEIKEISIPDDTESFINDIRSIIESKSIKLTPEQIAWDILTRLEENLKSLEIARGDYKKLELFYQRAQILLESFQKSRDTILETLYNNIQSKFIGLYRGLHGDDEKQFTAKIEPDKAGLNIEVDFYGRGTHPPHALHSEGHQDSMGLCLYLALAERLTEGLIDLIILDDVVMSVDADHRRQICQLLITNFPKRQFLITTHDKTWASQLKSEGFVQSKEIIEFYNWHVDSGPQVNLEFDAWKRIDEDLIKNDVPSASGKLRRWVEDFFASTCDLLHASVVFKSNGKWELGDFLPAAMKRFKQLIKQAEDSAQSWQDSKSLSMLQELDSTREQIYKRTNAEQWAINANVHYNNWANFTEQDFRPVVESFQDLHRLFICNSCGGMLKISFTKDKELNNVRCNCMKINWNLAKK